MSAQNPASLPASIDGSPSPASVDPATIPGPQAANLGDGAIGHLSEVEVDDLYRRWLQKTSFTYLTAAVERIVREHTERALADVEQRIEHGPHRLGHNVSVVCSCVRCEATHACLAIVRAARQEQNRG